MGMTLSRAGGIPFLLTLAACSGSEIGAPNAADRKLIVSKIAMVGVGIATASQGQGPFDNYVACPRRGIINFYNIPTGRAATLAGCDTGNGVVLDGTAEVRWADPRNRFAPMSAIEIVGAITVTTQSGAQSTVDRVNVTGIAFSPMPPALDRFNAGAVSIEAFGESYAFDNLALSANVFFPTTITIDQIPNSGGIGGLTETDLRRIAFQPARALARFLLDETFESNRGDHMHFSPCGTYHTIPESGGFVRVEANLTNCEIGPGMYVTGVFTFRWTLFSDPDLRMEITGSATFGGGVPRVTVDRLEWRMTGFVAGTAPYESTFSGLLAAGAQTRPYSFKIMVDD